MLNLADAFLREGACDKGALWYHRSLRLADSLGLPKSQCFPVYYGLGQVYMQLHVLNGVIFISTVLESTMMK